MIHTDPKALRAAVRAGQFRAQTSGQAPGYTQGNVAILPRDYAEEFLRFCQANPKPCPIIGLAEPGDPRLPMLGDIDIRIDVPRYRIWRDGKAVDDVDDVRALWRDDLVTFVLGCSFSFEEAILEAGVPIRHISAGKGVAMYRTNIETIPAGRFRGPLVVSMRPFKPADAIRAVQITSRFPNVHGAPVHLGMPHAIGIRDITKPDWGDFAGIDESELPVFWACGVTPQSVIEAARPPFCITHTPGHMLVTDLRNAQLAIL